MCGFCLAVWFFSIVLGPSGSDLFSGRTVEKLHNKTLSPSAGALRGRVVYTANPPSSVPAIRVDDFGWRVPNAPSELNLWWCTSTSKVGKKRPAPKEEKPVRVELAGNEEEAFQLVLRPAKPLKAVRMRTAAPPGVDSCVHVREVAYVDIKRPTDSFGCKGLWPDPLPEHKKPVDIEAKCNFPFWISVRIPHGTQHGDYLCFLVIELEGEAAFKIPVKIHVFDFSLPRVHSINTAFGFSPHLAFEYHNVSGGKARRKLFDLYMQNFRAHRISPYNFAPFDPIKVSLTSGGSGEGSEPTGVEVDFSSWDKQAEKYLDRYHFDSFRLRLRGLGGGTFHSRHYGKFGPYKQGTEGYERLFGEYASKVGAHLKKKGWLEKAYVYWFDEPQKKDYEFVKEGMRQIERAAPGLKRMLTEEPKKALTGYVDIWCPVLHRAEPGPLKERINAGEEVWWYVCCGPKAPYMGLFIDHPATDLRTWLWLSWKYGVTGILVWRCNYWTSSCAYPDKKQDPWKDPMSYQSGYGRPPGHIGYWGNGDGRFLYPPREVKGSAMQGPVDSIRWEMLREGIEDYEYLSLLERLIKRAEAENEEVEDFRGLLKVPSGICTTAKDYTRSAAPIYSRRREIAKAIEKLSGLLEKN